MTLNPLTALRNLFAYLRSSRKQLPVYRMGMDDSQRRRRFEQRPELRTLPPGSTDKDGNTPHPV